VRDTPFPLFSKLLGILFRFVMAQYTLAVTVDSRSANDEARWSELQYRLCGSPEAASAPLRVVASQANAQVSLVS
jgi:hypothetical protein